MFRRTAELYDIIYGSKNYAREAELLRDAIDARVRTKTVRLLDVACGTGAHLAHLRQWYLVEGLDLDEGLLAIARRKLPGVPLHQGDMLDFHVSRRFDVITCLFSAIGYAESVPRMRQAMWNMAAHLAPGGVLIVEPWLTPDVVQHGRVWHDTIERDGRLVIRAGRVAVEGRRSILEMHYLIADRDGVEHREERHVLGLFLREEYEQAMRDCGLDVAYDETGLTGRGLFIAKARVPALARTTYLPRPERGALRARAGRGSALYTVQ